MEVPLGMVRDSGGSIQCGKVGVSMGPVSYGCSEARIRSNSHVFCENFGLSWKSSPISVSEWHAFVLCGCGLNSCLVFEAFTKNPVGVAVT